eukprot:9472440-Pyramimonas_sp.AAC.2
MSPARGMRSSFRIMRMSRAKRPKTSWKGRDLQYIASELYSFGEVPMRISAIALPSCGVRVFLALQAASTVAVGSVARWWHQKEKEKEGQGAKFEIGERDGAGEEFGKGRAACTRAPFTKLLTPRSAGYNPH